MAQDAIVTANHPSQAKMAAEAAAPHPPSWIKSNKPFIRETFLQPPPQPNHTAIATAGRGLRASPLSLTAPCD